MTISGNITPLPEFSKREKNGQYSYRRWEWLLWRVTPDGQFPDGLWFSAKLPLQSRSITQNSSSMSEICGLDECAVETARLRPDRKPPGPCGVELIEITCQSR